jgi:hypothetical protein
MVIGLTIGCGDIVPVTAIGSLVAIGPGVAGIVVTGMIVTIAVYALCDAAEKRRISEE